MPLPVSIRRTMCFFFFCRYDSWRCEFW